MKDNIEKLNSSKYLLGVTGSIGCGKSYTCNKLILESALMGIEAHQISVDKIRRYILSNSPKYNQVRSKIVERFEPHIVNSDSSINIHELNKRTFANDQSMKDFKEIINPSIRNNIRRYHKNKNGIVLVEWAMLMEDNFYQSVKYNMLIVTCDYQKQIKRLSGGDLSMNKIHQRINGQMNNQDRKGIAEYIKRNDKGDIYFFDTTSDPLTEEYRHLLEEIVCNIK
jgi:dephospho-CoA kinase